MTGKRVCPLFRTVRRANECPLFRTVRQASVGTPPHSVKHFVSTHPKFWIESKLLDHRPKKWTCTIWCTLLHENANLPNAFAIKRLRANRAFQCSHVTENCTIWCTRPQSALQRKVLSLLALAVCSHVLARWHACCNIRVPRTKKSGEQKGQEAVGAVIAQSNLTMAQAINNWTGPRWTSPVLG